MSEVIRFALLGLGVGALYAFASQGLIVIYRGTGVLNFSLGATAIAGVFMQWELHKNGMPFLAASAIGVLWAAFLGALTHWVIMRPLRRASSLVRVIATLGVLITIQAGVVLRYGSESRQVKSWLPTNRVTLWGDVGTTVDRFILLGIASVSAFMYATISTVRVWTSWQTTGTRPAASYLTAASCSGVAVMEMASGMGRPYR